MCLLVHENSYAILQVKLHPKSSQTVTMMDRSAPSALNRGRTWEIITSLV